MRLSNRFFVFFFTKKKTFGCGVWFCFVFVSFTQTCNSLTHTCTTFTCHARLSNLCSPLTNTQTHIHTFSSFFLFFYFLAKQDPDPATPGTAQQTASPRTPRRCPGNSTGTCCTRTSSSGSSSSTSSSGSSTGSEASSSW